MRRAELDSIIKLMGIKSYGDSLGSNGPVYELDSSLRLYRYNYLPIGRLSLAFTTLQKYYAFDWENHVRRLANMEDQFTYDATSWNPTTGELGKWATDQDNLVYETYNAQGDLVGCQDNRDLDNTVLVAQVPQCLRTEVCGLIKKVYKNDLHDWAFNR